MATIKDVAQKVGVTSTTVSRVLNNRGYISDKTRKAVYQAMEELNYQPNEVARSLSKKDTNCIGVLIPSIQHPFFSQVLSSLEYHASRRGYKIMVCNSQEDHEREREYLGMLDSNRVSGIIFCSRSGGVEGTKGTSRPIIAFERELSDEIPVVLCDNYQGGVLATQRLLDSGCKKLLALDGSREVDLPANARCQAFMKTCDTNGVQGKVFHASEYQFTKMQYEDWIEEIIRENQEADGVFATSDVIGAQVIRVCRKLGIAVPERLQVIGFDDTIIAELTCPALTTIHQPIDQMCEYAVDAIARKMRGDMVPIKVILPVRLVERESVRARL